MTHDLDAAVAAHAEEAFAFLSALVAAPSTVGSEQAALEVFAEEMAALGLTPERLPFPNEPVSDSRAGVSPPAATLTDNRFQVLATTPGDGPLTVLLNGHIDVVPATSPEQWTTPPFEPSRRDGRMYGRGTADMKGGFAIGALALRALRDTHPDLFATQRLGFLAVIEEECTGNGALLAARDHGVTAPEVVVLEPTDLGLMVGGVGVLWVRLTVYAASAHAFEAEATGNAIDLGMGLVEAIRVWATSLNASHPETALTDGSNAYNVNLGQIRAGDWTSSSAASAVLDVRVGYPRGWSPEQAEDAVRQVVLAAVEADGRFPRPPTVEPTGLRARGYLLDAEHRLVQDLSSAHRAAHGREAEVVFVASTTDARTFLEDFDTPAVCFGAVAHDMHGIDESVELDSIVDAARTLARFLLMRFGGEHG